MSSVQDRPDIEKLPLEIDGVSVRETIREIFHNPENGTPDNISKAGCLALAIKSNEVGRTVGGDKTHVLWNAWRERFAVTRGRLRSRNAVDFSAIDFRNEPNDDILFSNMQFGDDADFSFAQFGNYANFQFAQFGERAVFVGALFEGRANFDVSRLGDGADFSVAQFANGADFTVAQFGANTQFVATQFGAQTDFRGAQFGNRVDFRYAHFGDEAIFRGYSWKTLQTVYGHHFQAAKDWADARNLLPDVFRGVRFSGAVFEGTVDFSDRQFSSTTDFGLLHVEFTYTDVVRDKDQRPVQDEDSEWQTEEKRPTQHHVSFGKAPIFHGCELHQDTSFEGVVFPLATGSDEAARAYRTLKLAFSKQQAIREEQRFFRLEMEEETLRETGLKRWLFKAYKKFSDYGFSITHPLKYGGLSVLALTAVYGLLSWLGQCGLSVQACHFAPQWLEFSLLQTLPLPGLDKLSEAASKAFWPAGAWWSLGLSALVILHKTISLAALFLIGLALRNLFKLK